MDDVNTLSTFLIFHIMIEEKLKELKNLIENWEFEKENLEDMLYNWNDSEDPTCDPGLQFEQEEAVEDCINEIKKYCRDNIVN